MPIKIDLVAIQVSVAHGGEKSLHSLSWRHTVLAEHLCGDFRSDVR